MKKLKKLILPICIISLLLTTSACDEVDRLGLYKFYGPSMEPTIENGEYIRAITGTEIERGDIVVIEVPQDQSTIYIKRIIGMPGETVVLEDGKVKIIDDENPDGYFLEEDYLVEGTQTLPAFKSEINRFEIPEGSYFALGDNRIESVDSRHCFRQIFSGGCRGELNGYFVTKEHIQGVVELIN